MRTLRTGLLGLLALTATPPIARAQQQKPTVAVLNFSAFALAQDAGQLGTTLLDMITTELASKDAIRVIERAQVEDLLTKQKLLVSGRVSDADGMRAGKLLGAQYIVSGSIVMDRTDARLDIRLVDVETGLTVRSFKQKGKQDQLLALVEQVAEDFTKDLDLPARSAAAAPEAPATAVLAYSQGLDFEKRGMKSRAAQMYEKALQIFPGHRDAQIALARVK